MSRRFARGLAAERTALAWRRSVAGLLGIALLVGRDALTHWPPLAGAIATSVVAGVVVGAVAVGQRRFSRLREPTPGPPSPRVITLMTVAVLVVALFGATLMLRP